MTDEALIASLVRKSQRAVRSADRDLAAGDTDGAVNRGYYAMFNASRAAPLSSGVAERELPRTHRGIFEAFRKQALLTGRVDPEIAGALGRAEALRLKADYTATEIDAVAARAIVDEARIFFRTIMQEFGLSAHLEHEPGKTFSLDEEQAKAAQKWRSKTLEAGSEPENKAQHRPEHDPSLGIDEDTE